MLACKKQCNSCGKEYVNTARRNCLMIGCDGSLRKVPFTKDIDLVDRIKTLPDVDDELGLPTYVFGINASIPVAELKALTAELEQLRALVTAAKKALGYYENGMFNCRCQYGIDAHIGELCRFNIHKMSNASEYADKALEAFDALEK